MNYWQKRIIDSQNRLTTKGIKDIERQLVKYYQKTMIKVISDFESTLDRLLKAANEGREPTPADLYKLDSYWQLQAQCKAELTKLGDKQAALLSKRFTEQYITIYNSVAIPSQTAFATLDTAAAQQMINQIWVADGKSWSNRIWGNTEKLMEELNESLIDCVVAGRKTTELKNMLQERFNVSYSRADSLVRTEMAHIQTQAAKQRYTDYGIKEVEIWADKDERRCDVCGKLHEKRYPIGAHVPIPAHPRCRCCIVPVVD